MNFVEDLINDVAKDDKKNQNKKQSREHHISREPEIDKEIQIIGETPKNVNVDRVAIKKGRNKEGGGRIYANEKPSNKNTYRNEKSSAEKKYVIKKPTPEAFNTKKGGVNKAIVKINRLKDKNGEDAYKVYKSEKENAPQQSALDKLLFPKKYGPVNLNVQVHAGGNNEGEYQNLKNMNNEIYNNYDLVFYFDY